MIDFIVQYKEVFLAALSLLCALVSSILYVVGAKSSKAKVIASLFEAIPSFINDAEAKCCTGEGKFRYVINSCLDYLGSLGIRREAALKKYYSLISSMVEAILSTPQKKELKK